ncbi:DUF2905 domain-containing protein [Peredibacter starrii]|uniref:DUF2905 domain-containing protein n=1 Tax=Peredibacter starrii TaxID=28202 RepID=A0AAX4HTV1_9BACT|nr:DUF2905 domain-containing protein [Peredibacter starrii]WPU66749.1 DUF2905 domain-containing protein [Peredibacter starrii]
MNPISKTLIIIGVVLIVSGLLWHFSGGKIPLGRLPGDIRIEGENTKVFIPITTSLLLSALLSLIMYFFRK